MDYLGAHMSISGGIHLAPGRGAAAGCGVMQIFTQNASQWRGKMPSPADAALFREQRAVAGLRDVVSHDIYLINLAAAPGEVRDKSLAAFREEMLRCALLGIDKIVMHPGSHLGDGEAVGLERIIAAFDSLIEATPEFTGRILLENTAGQGTNLGFRFDHLQTIIDGSTYPDRFGVCLDTCHAVAAGYELRTPDGYAATFAEFHRLIGVERLACFHLNDSKKGLGSHVDRHEHIGQGELGLEPFRLLLNDPRFVTVPKIIETPKGEAEDMDAVNLALLRGLIER
jgi:deoxyribonuclease-4